MFVQQIGRVQSFTVIVMNTPEKKECVYIYIYAYIYICIHIQYIYVDACIYIPGTQMTLVLVRKGLVLRG